MPSGPKVTDSDKKWEPKTSGKWEGVPLGGDGQVDPNSNPFNPEDPAGDWGAYLDAEGVLVVEYCGEGSRKSWIDLYPAAPAKHERHIHTEGDECRAGQAEEDVQVEVLERAMWYREYRCAFVVMTSMTWRITRQKWICDNSGLPVSPGGPGVWTKQGAETVETVSRSRKTEFRCC